MLLFEIIKMTNELFLSGSPNLQHFPNISIFMSRSFHLHKGHTADNISETCICAWIAWPIWVRFAGEFIWYTILDVGNRLILLANLCIRFRLLGCCVLFLENIYFIFQWIRGVHTVRPSFGCCPRILWDEDIYVFSHSPIFSLFTSCGMSEMRTTDVIKLTNGRLLTGWQLNWLLSSTPSQPMGKYKSVSD